MSVTRRALEKRIVRAAMQWHRFIVTDDPLEGDHESKDAAEGEIDAACALLLKMTEKPKRKRREG